MDRISYIVPVYNAEKYITRCIESCLENMHGYDELILIDDGSTDRSGRICDAYADGWDNIKVIHQTNRGESAARNSGLAAASKEWIVCIDADDLLAREARNILNGTIADDIDIVLYSYQKGVSGWDGTGYVSGRTRIYGEDSRDYFVKGCFKGEMDFAPLCKFNPRSVWAKAFRRAFIEQNGIRFHEGVFIGEDCEFMLECYSRASKIKYTDKFLYGYFFNNTKSVTNKFKINLIDNTTASRKAMKKWLCEFPKYRDDYYTYCLDMLILHIRDDFYHPENKMSKREKIQHMDDVLDKGGYKKYYEASRSSKRIKVYPLSKRVIFKLAVDKRYDILQFIYNIRYRLMIYRKG